MRDDPITKTAQANKQLDFIFTTFQWIIFPGTTLPTARSMDAAESRPNRFCKRRTTG